VIEGNWDYCARRLPDCHHLTRLGIRKSWKDHPAINRAVCSPGHIRAGRGLGGWCGDGLAETCLFRGHLQRAVAVFEGGDDPGFLPEASVELSKQPLRTFIA
jgi:hypothetical protein